MTASAKPSAPRFAPPLGAQIGPASMTTWPILGGHIKDFLARARAWHATLIKEPTEPEHAALVTSLGSGKSSLSRAALPQFITCSG